MQADKDRKITKNSGFCLDKQKGVFFSLGVLLSCLGSGAWLHGVCVFLCVLWC